jgi:hypothetical protein
LQTFGVSDPGPDDLIQPLVHANTLAFWKKAISYYMPDRLVHGWRSGSNDGNPTKSAEVNDFIKQVKKSEARKQGADSQTQQLMLETEFRQLHKIFRSSVHDQQQHLSNMEVWDACLDQFSVPFNCTN